MNFDKELLKDFDSNYEVLAKSVDDANPRLDYKNIRGYSGVCTFWKKSLTPSIRTPDLGNERIIVLEITTTSKPICLINAYMPSTSINSDEEYKDCLIELSEMVQIYQHTHNVILCGDMNASLQRHTCRDRLFQDVVTDNILHTTEQQSSDDHFSIITENIVQKSIISL